MDKGSVLCVLGPVGWNLCTGKDFPIVSSVDGYGVVLLIKPLELHRESHLGSHI